MATKQNPEGPGIAIQLAETLAFLGSETRPKSHLNFGQHDVYEDKPGFQTFLKFPMT
jgi:hypothetical protein